VIHKKHTRRLATTGARHFLSSAGRLVDLQRLFGCKRGFAYELINSSKLKYVCLRKLSANTGERLIHLLSVRDYLMA